MIRIVQNNSFKQIFKYPYPIYSMPSWRDTLSQGRNTKRNTFLGIAGMFTILTFLTGDKNHFFTVPFALLLAYLFAARLEWGWEIPSRARKGERFFIKLHMRNKALSYFLFKGDIVYDIHFTIEIQAPLHVIGENEKNFSSLEAGKGTKIEFQLSTPPDAAPDLYGITIASSCSTGKSKKYFEIYIYDEE